MERTGGMILWHLPISHYSEKARWALALKSAEHERRTAQAGMHIAVAMRLTRGRHYTFPVLELGGERIGDSTAIIAKLEERFPEPALYPTDPVERRRALELEDWFDENLGPYIRRFLFNQGRNDRDYFDEVVARMAPPALARHKRAYGVGARLFTALRFGAGSSRAAERARRRLLAALDRLEAELGDGRYLVGDRFTVADLTAAALFYPLVLPPEGPQVMNPVAPGWEEFRSPFKGRRGYRWVEEMFRRHRQPAATAPSEMLSTS
ncbi:MAG: glutathione S-transferase N-terminal domain-containing protein [Thermoleophilaceae bacterium]